MKNKKHLLLASLLAFSLLATNIQAYADDEVSAENTESTVESDFDEADRNLLKNLEPGDLTLVELSSKELEDYEVPEVITAKEIRTNEHANRLFAQETDEYSVVFQNKDGSKTMYYFDEPVKYIDENGTMHDKSTKLFQSDTDGYAYVSAENDVNVYMPEQLDDETGIIIKSNEYLVEMSPVDSFSADISDIIKEKVNVYDEYELVEYNNVFGSGTTIEYSAQLNGVKENIILDQYNGNNEFSFEVDTNGLKLIDEDGYFSIVDEEKNEIVGTISEVVLFDSSNGEKTIVPQGYVNEYKAVENTDGKYTITIVIDDEWLSNDAVYPVIIDPTITIVGSGSGSSKTILDAPVYSKKNTTNFGSYSIGTIGYQDSTYGIGRLLIRFPGLDSNTTYKNIKAGEIESAKLYMYEGTGNTGTSTLLVRYSQNTSGWAETAPMYVNTSATGAVMSTTTITKSGMCSFDFTDLAINSKYAANDIKKGILITNTNETNSSLRRSFYMTENSGTKPRIVIEWNPVIDGMAYIFKTDSDNCLEFYSQTLIENPIMPYTTNGCSYYYRHNQIWITKKATSGGYHIYSSNQPSQTEQIKYAICTSTGSDVRIANCTSDIDPYFCWDFEKVSQNSFAIKNRYSEKWLYKKSDNSFGLTDNASNRLVLTKAKSNYPSSWNGSYTGQSGHYKLNIIFSNKSDYNSFASAAEAWNGICDKISVEAYEPNSNPSSGLNVTVARKSFSSAGLSSDTLNNIYARFIPNATVDNFPSGNNSNDTSEINANWQQGVIFINEDTGMFDDLSEEKQRASITHEVGHALKLCHSNQSLDNSNNILSAPSIMKKENDQISTFITLYDQSSLIKKWREMP